MKSDPSRARNLLKQLAGGLIVSCQPVPGGPFDTVAGVVAFARAAEASGACGLRIEGAANVAAVVQACTLPVIGLIKHDLDASPVRITPFLEDVETLADAGATIVAIDATARTRRYPFMFCSMRSTRAGGGRWRIALHSMTHVTQSRQAPM